MQALNLRLGRENGQRRFTGVLDTVNHVVAAGEAAAAVLEVLMRTQDGQAWLVDTDQPG